MIEDYNRTGYKDIVCPYRREKLCKQYSRNEKETGESRESNSYIIQISPQTPV